MIDERDLQIETVQILDESGNHGADDVEGFEDQLLLSMYRWMVKARQFDHRMLKLQRQGRIGTYAPCQGQEAAQVGSALALDKEDWIFPTYREQAASMVRGMPIKDILLRYKGYFGGGEDTSSLHIFPVQIIIAGQTLHAAGCALASRLNGEKNVSVAYFGDGATSQGDFHEAMNFASVNRAPALFFCQNNQWAISVPRHKQTASQSIAQKAVAYGMKGIQVDGNDCLAVYQVTKDVVKRIREGEGPMLIEVVTHRRGPHTTSDDPTRYRIDEEVSEWDRKDPLIRFRKFLESRELWSEKKENEELDSIKQELDQVVREVEEMKPAALPELFDHVYDRLDPLLVAQKQEVASRLKERM